MGKERRRFERIESLIEIRYKGRSQDISGYSLTRDVSEGGMGLPVSGSIPAGTSLNLEINLGGASFRKEIAAAAKVAWSRRNAEHWKPRYSAGLRFIKIADDDKQDLMDYARKNRWVKSDFERSLEENKIPILGRRGELTI
jgi:c-di-GMP-binding flagellar brake protein YcgR